MPLVGAAYLRCSDPRQDKSLEQQRAEIERRAAADAVVIPAAFACRLTVTTAARPSRAPAPLAESMRRTTRRNGRGLAPGRRQAQCQLEERGVVRAVASQRNSQLGRAMFGDGNEVDRFLIERSRSTTRAPQPALATERGVPQARPWDRP